MSKQNLNSDFTDSALGSTEKPFTYGNFQLRDTTVQSILSHPRYGPKVFLFYLKSTVFTSGSVPDPDFTGVLSCGIEV
ncbi:hypothetical protein MSG28_001476 [Choristoneura fumiferana]|uniref:Uncharacterized protein n=1 Tax=Choristoneura fumiferana TaxID=7141 RepID=A0ACC0KUQ6_CHOFU|nr:hypothetical protein MSG28_001476 [Choristoneura fumiferana]